MRIRCLRERLLSCAVMKYRAMCTSVCDFLQFTNSWMDGRYRDMDEAEVTHAPPRNEKFENA